MEVEQKAVVEPEALVPEVPEPEAAACVPVRLTRSMAAQRKPLGELSANVAHGTASPKGGAAARRAAGAGRLGGAKRIKLGEDGHSAPAGADMF